MDFRDLGLFISVATSTTLMRRKPATAGMPGRDVLGQVMPPTPGKDTPFAPKLPGTVLDAKDSKLLRAAITGQPLRLHSGVTVKPVLTEPAVDLSTGHIDFDKSSTPRVNACCAPLTAWWLAATTHARAGMKVYGDVVVKLGELTLQIRDERAAGTLRCIDDVIAFE